MLKFLEIHERRALGWMHEKFKGGSCWRAARQGSIEIQIQNSARTCVIERELFPCKPNTSMNKLGAFGFTVAGHCLANWRRIVTLMKMGHGGRRCGKLFLISVRRSHPHEQLCSASAGFAYKAEADISFSRLMLPNTVRTLGNGQRGAQIASADGP